jgi:squalene-hopene/tetraprenyl-beta-curcumene cyclase
MNRRLFLATSIAALLAVPGLAQAPASPLKHDPALRAKVAAAIEKGLGFLDKQQKPEGCWSTTDYPGLTALIVQAYLAAPGGRHARSATARKGLDFIRSNAKPDGSISADRMANYNTSICLATLVRAGDARDQKTIDAARRFLVGGQVANAVNPAGNGGFGYDPASGTKPARADLDNTVFALEALRLYREANPTKEVPPGQDLNWQAAVDFLTRCQQLPSHNKEKWVSGDESERGGFVYTPTSDGKELLRAYGTMTYAGVLSLLYADLKKDDPRLLAARDWLAKHYTLEENPGQGAQGLYYYYHLMAKGLTALQINELKTADGRTVNWRADLAAKLLSLQKPDGSWASENGRWMEKDPNLVTTYCLLALAYVHDQL